MLFLDDVKYDKITLFQSMAGHSKWANIKRKKEVVDKKRSSLFTKLSKAITMAVIESNGETNPAFNARLRFAIEKAKEGNMPKENIERAIKKGSGPDRETLSELVYEGFGPSGEALIITVTTDNPNRSLAEIRSILERRQGKLASTGAVSYLFLRSTEGERHFTPAFQITHDSQEVEERIAELILDLEYHDDVQNVYTNVDFRFL